MGSIPPCTHDASKPSKTVVLRKRCWVGGFILRESETRVFLVATLAPCRFSGDLTKMKCEMCESLSLRKEFLSSRQKVLDACVQAGSWKGRVRLSEIHRMLRSIRSLGAGRSGRAFLFIFLFAGRSRAGWPVCPSLRCASYPDGARLAWTSERSQRKCRSSRSRRPKLISGKRRTSRWHLFSLSPPSDRLVSLGTLLGGGPAANWAGTP